MNFDVVLYSDDFSVKSTSRAGYSSVLECLCGKQECLGSVVDTIKYKRAEKVNRKPGHLIFGEETETSGLEIGTKVPVFSILNTL